MRACALECGLYSYSRAPPFVSAAAAGCVVTRACGRGCAPSLFKKTFAASLFSFLLYFLQLSGYFLAPLHCFLVHLPRASSSLLPIVFWFFFIPSCVCVRVFFFLVFRGRVVVCFSVMITAPPVGLGWTLLHQTSWKAQKGFLERKGTHVPCHSALVLLSRFFYQSTGDRTQLRSFSFSLRSFDREFLNRRPQSPILRENANLRKNAHDVNLLVVFTTTAFFRFNLR